MTGSAKQSMAARKKGLLRRGACHRARIRATRWLLAMTMLTGPRSRDAECARAVHIIPSNKRAQQTPGAGRTRSLACEVNKAHERSHHRLGRFHPAFPAQWF
jgi:hypothetical protein